MPCRDVTLFELTKRHSSRLKTLTEYLGGKRPIVLPFEDKDVLSGLLRMSEAGRGAEAARVLHEHELAGVDADEEDGAADGDGDDDMARSSAAGAHAAGACGKAKAAGKQRSAPTQLPQGPVTDVVAVLPPLRPLLADAAASGDGDASPLPALARLATAAIVHDAVRDAIFRSTTHTGPLLTHSGALASLPLAGGAALVAAAAGKCGSPEALAARVCPKLTVSPFMASKSGAAPAAGAATTAAASSSSAGAAAGVSGTGSSSSVQMVSNAAVALASVCCDLLRGLADGSPAAALAADRSAALAAVAELASDRIAATAAAVPGDDVRAATGSDVTAALTASAPALPLALTTTTFTKGLLRVDGSTVASTAADLRRWLISVADAAAAVVPPAATAGAPEAAGAASAAASAAAVVPAAGAAGDGTLPAGLSCVTAHTPEELAAMRAHYRRQQDQREAAGREMLRADPLYPRTSKDDLDDGIDDVEDDDDDDVDDGPALGLVADEEDEGMHGVAAGAAAVGAAAGGAAAAVQPQLTPEQRRQRRAERAAAQKAAKREAESEKAARDGVSAPYALGCVFHCALAPHHATTCCALVLTLFMSCAGGGAVEFPYVRHWRPDAAASAASRAVCPHSTGEGSACGHQCISGGCTNTNGWRPGGNIRCVRSLGGSNCRCLRCNHDCGREGCRKSCTGGPEGPHASGSDQCGVGCPRCSRRFCCFGGCCCRGGISHRCDSCHRYRRF